MSLLHGMWIMLSHIEFVACKLIVNPLNAKLNPICHLLALLEAHFILHVSRIRFKETSGFGIKWMRKKNT